MQRLPSKAATVKLDGLTADLFLLLSSVSSRYLAFFCTHGPPSTGLHGGIPLRPQAWKSRMSRPSPACVMSLLCTAEISTFSPCRPVAASHRPRLPAWLRPSGLVCLHLWDVLLCVELMFVCLDPCADSALCTIVPPAPPPLQQFLGSSSGWAQRILCRGVGLTPALQVRWA